MTDLIDTTEMYLRTILELEEEGFVPMRARIADRLGHSGPTVSQTVARMERDGLVHVGEDRTLALTDEGRQTAIHVMRKHRIAERLLADVIGLEWELVHEEACRWEHVMSEQVERKILAMLGYPTESPYGNPIPGLDELGQPATAPFSLGVVNVDQHTPKDGSVVRGILRRLGEPIQSDIELLVLLQGAGVMPGAVIECSRPTGGLTVHVEVGKEKLELPQDVAVHLFIAPSL
jgi:DtxR family Mn-dependent transcriptional regulator